MKVKYLSWIIVWNMMFLQILIAGEIMKVEEKTFQLKSGGTITVIGDEGKIKINAWNKEEVYLKMTKRVWHRNKKMAEELMDELEVEIDHTDKYLYIKEVDYGNRHNYGFWDFFDQDTWQHRSGHQIDYELTLPKKVNLKIENDEGDVEIAEISGRVKLRVDEGDIMLNGLSSVELDIELDEGDLKCKNIRGNRSTIYVNIDEGAVRLSNCEFEQVDIDSDEGYLILNNLKIMNCDLKSDEGDIAAELDIMAEGRERIRTDEGDIKLILSEDIDAKLRLETNEGRIRSDFPVSIRRSRDEGEKVNEILGKGLVRVDVFTENGDIILERK